MEDCLVPGETSGNINKILAIGSNKANRYGNDETLKNDSVNFQNQDGTADNLA